MKRPVFSSNVARRSRPTTADGEKHTSDRSNVRRCLECISIVCDIYPRTTANLLTYFPLVTKTYSLKTQWALSVVKCQDAVAEPVKLQMHASRNYTLYVVYQRSQEHKKPSETSEFMGVNHEQTKDTFVRKQPSCWYSNTMTHFFFTLDKVHFPKEVEWLTSTGWR